MPSDLFCSAEPERAPPHTILEVVRQRLEVVRQRGYHVRLVDL
jgi:hypothetical protein